MPERQRLAPVTRSSVRCGLAARLDVSSERGDLRIRDA
jgi:hypothetical protein